MKNINSGKTIIIADVHQNIGYVDKVLSQEKEFDNCVFLGDWLDTFYDIDNANYYSVHETCGWINQHLDDDRFIWLLGNHDLAYIASYSPKKYTTPKETFYCCSGWTRSKARAFNYAINPLLFDKIELCCKVGDFHCVHGGFHYGQFAPYLSEEDNVAKLYADWENDKHTFMFKPYHWINYVSALRRGHNDTSSPIWLDWREFIPMDDIQIICGHSNSLEIIDAPRIKKNKDGLENYCIDYNQQIYAVADFEKNSLTIKTIAGMFLSESKLKRLKS